MDKLIVYGAPKRMWRLVVTEHRIEQENFRWGLEEVTHSMGIETRKSEGKRAPASFQSWGGWAQRDGPHIETGEVSEIQEIGGH
jgi:hypothetical protein